MLALLSAVVMTAPTTVVMIHGIGVSSWAWRMNVDVLADRATTTLTRSFTSR